MAQVCLGDGRWTHRWGQDPKYYPSLLIHQVLPDLRSFSLTATGLIFFDTGKGTTKQGSNIRFSEWRGISREPSWSHHLVGWPLGASAITHWFVQDRSPEKTLANECQCSSGASMGGWERQRRINRREAYWDSNQWKEGFPKLRDKLWSSLRDHIHG